MGKVAETLADLLWERFEESYSDQIARARELRDHLEELDEEQTQEVVALLEGLGGGYCVAGRFSTGERCRALEVDWLPWMDEPRVSDVPEETPIFWGVPHVMQRVIVGFDQDGLIRILQSGKLNGTEEELYKLVSQDPLIQPQHLPIREAVDWIHTIIHVTIKGIKFASLPHVCGGPVEIAAITTDRPFRWGAP